MDPVIALLIANLPQMVKSAQAIVELVIKLSNEGYEVPNIDEYIKLNDQLRNLPTLKEKSDA